MITDAKTAEAYEKKLRSTLIFRNADSFGRVCIDVLLIVIAMSSSILVYFFLLFTHTVPRYVLGRVDQPPAIDIPPKTYPLWFGNIPNEDVHCSA